MISEKEVDDLDRTAKCAVAAMGQDPPHRARIVYDAARYAVELIVWCPKVGPEPNESARLSLELLRTAGGITSHVDRVARDLSAKLAVRLAQPHWEASAPPGCEVREMSAEEREEARLKFPRAYTVEMSAVGGGSITYGPDSVEITHETERAEISVEPRDHVPFWVGSGRPPE